MPFRSFPAVLPLAYALIVAGWTLLAFLPSLGGEFLQWDDPQTVTQNPAVQGLGWDQVRWAFSTFYMGHYQPLTWLSYAADWSVWGLDPFGFRLSNLLLHVTTSILLFFVARRVVLGLAPVLDLDLDGFGSWLAPLVGTLFFAVHPLRTESVAWITERRDVLCGLFLVAATLAYLIADDRAEFGHRTRWLGVSTVLYALSLLSKASAIAFPVALVCLDLARARRIGWRSKIPFVALALPYLLIAPMAQEATRAAISFELLSVVDRLWIATYGLAFYLTRTLWPVGLSALHELPYPLGTRDGRFPWAVAVLLGAALVLGALWRLRPQWFRAVALSTATSLAFLLPVLGFFQSGPQLVAERYTYFAALPLSLLLAVAFARLGVSRWRVPAVVGAFACLVLLSAVSHRLAQTWRTDDDLFSRAVAVDPTCALCNAKLGHVRLAQGRTPQAEALFKAGLDKLPTMTDSIWALVKIYRAEGRFEESLPYLNGLLRRDPHVEDNWREMARALWHTGRIEAMAELFANLPDEFAEHDWPRSYRRAMAAVGGPAAPPPTTPEEMDAVVTLLSETGRCLPANRTEGAPEWIRRAHVLCSS